MEQVRRGEPSEEQSWEGFLQPAGLIDGPLKVRPDRGRYYWIGTTPVSGHVRLTVFDAEGPLSYVVRTRGSSSIGGEEQERIR